MFTNSSTEKSARKWADWNIEPKAVDSARIVACVNACENLADPGAVPELLAALRELMTGHSMAGQAMAEKAIARATGEKGGK